MKFGAIPLGKALGATLAHGIAVAEARFAKGRILSAGDIDLLAKAGQTTVTVARLGKKDLPENEAATRIGAKLATVQIAAKKASTGRVNLQIGRAHV